MIDALCLLVALTAGFQNPPPPPPPPAMRAPRDPTTIKKGTAVIKGRVVNTDGRPLRRVQIRAIAGDPRDAITTTTGLEGEYELRELPAARYTLEATRGGYLPARYGQSEYGKPAATLTVAEGATIDKIDFVLGRAGVVNGRVTDETGDPVAGVDVRAMQMQFFKGRKQLVPVLTTAVIHATTDDTGQYRLTGLPPGEYYVAGRLSETWMSDDKPPQMLSYAPTYFPGTADVAEARRVKISTGQEAGAVDFTLVAARAATVSGTALASNGNALTRGRISLVQEVMGPTGGSTFFSGGATINDDGTWKVDDVAPGEYLVRATGTAGDGPPETAALPLTVLGADVEGVLLTADPGAVVSGRLVTDTREPLPASASRIAVATTPVSMVSGGVRPTPGQDDGTVGADGTFTRKSPSGSVVIRVFSLPRGWAIRNIDIGGRDYAGLPVELSPGRTLANVTIVVTNRLPSVSGRVTGADDKPAAATVLLFPVDPSRWIEAAANQRTARPDRTGAYTVDAVRPGDYFILALESMETWQMNDPEFLSLQKSRATTITIGSEPMTLDLKVVR